VRPREAEVTSLGARLAGPEGAGGHHFEQPQPLPQLLPQELQQSLQQQEGSQQYRLWNSRFSQLSFWQQQELQQSLLQQLLLQQLLLQLLLQQLLLPQLLQHGSQHGAHSTGTRRHRLTHTSSGTQTLTRLQTVQGTHSVTV
jgi:hypothetical protein